MSDPLVTFVIPTVGRHTLVGAVASLNAQSDDGWCAIVVTDGDGVATPMLGNPRVELVAAPARHSAGLTRNHALPLVASEWTAFLDDDDTVSREYVERLRALGAGADVVIFRMQTRDGGVLPPWIHPQIRWGQVGISFAVRTAWLAGRGVCFIREHDVDDRFGAAANEDIQLLEHLQALGARTVIADHIGYLVGGAVTSPDYAVTEER